MPFQETQRDLRTLKIVTAEDAAPCHDNILVSPDEVLRQTEGGIALPDTAERPVNTGRVIAVGPGKLVEPLGDDYASLRHPVSCKAGDRIIFRRAAHIEVDEKQILVVSDRDVVAVLTSS